MGLVHCTAILAIVSISWLPTKCSKTPAGNSSASTNSVAANPNAHNLGEVVMTNHYETLVDIGNGKSCLIVPRLYDRKAVELTMSLQSKNADGDTDQLNVMRVEAQDGKPFEVAIGDMDLTLTPKVVQLAQ